MRILALIGACTLATAATLASAAEPAGQAPRERALMLYVSKSFGSSQRLNRTPLAFGLRLQQSAPLEPTRAVAVIDARYSLGGRRTLDIGGLRGFDSSDDSSASSVTVARDHPALTTIGVVLVVLGILCVAETGPCKKDGDSPYNETTNTDSD